MATLIDEGLVEDCLDETITIPDLEDIPIIDLDDIDATIEDPGCILDEPVNSNEETEEYTSSYKKGSFTLPVQFFDIDRNVSLLKQCRPISIKIVDCNIHPWYYEGIKNKAIKSIEPIKDLETTIDEDKDKDMLKNALSDFISFKCNDTNNKKPFPVNESNSHEIKLSSRQSLAISKLKEDIEEKIRTYKIDKAYDLNGNTDGIITDNYLLPESDKIIDECFLDKNNDVVNPTDLLTYEAIAQTIVRNLDYGGVNSSNDKVLICEKKSEEKEICVDAHMRDEDVELVNVEEIEDLLSKEKDEQASERIITSPILPCTIRPKKNRKEKLIRPSPIPNTIFRICNDPSKTCHKFVSADKVIPHYHYIIPNSTSTKNTNNSFISNNTLNYADNSSLSQYTITRDTYSYYVNQPKQYVHKSKCPCNSERPTCNPLMRLESYANRVAFTSGLDYAPVTYNDPPLQNAPFCTPPLFNVKKPSILKNNINSNAYLPYSAHPGTRSINASSIIPQQDNRGPVPAYPTTDTTINVGNLRGPEFSKENCRVLTQNSAPPFMLNSLYPRNEYISTKRLSKPSLMTVAIVERKIRDKNPLLAKLLNSNRASVITSTDNNGKMNADMAHSNQILTGPSISDTKTSNKINVDSLITVLPHNNGDSLKRINDSSTISNTSIKNNTKLNNVNKAVQEITTLNTHKDNTKFDSNRCIKKLQPIKHDSEIIKTSEQIPRKICSYSPPILPIPTFKKGLEILSKLRPYVPSNDNGRPINKNSKSNINNSGKEHNEIINMKRKRIPNCDEKVLVTKNRKISLQEYKQRMLNNSKDAYIKSKLENTTRMQNGETKLHAHEGSVIMGMPYLGCGS